MTTHNARILTSFLTIMTVFLLWLIAVVLKDSLPNGQIQIIPSGDILILVILFIPAVSLAGIIVIRLVPVLFGIPDATQIGFLRILFCLVFIGIFLFGLIV
jgi:hypothetical protein